MREVFVRFQQVCRSSGGYGTWKIHKKEDYDYWMKQIGKSMPYAETILTEMVENIEHDFCCHLYLSRKGDVTWIAALEKIMSDDGIWIGSVLQVCSNTRLRIRVYSAHILPETFSLSGLSFTPVASSIYLSIYLLLVSYPRTQPKPAKCSEMSAI